MTLPAKDDFATYGGQKTDYTDVVDPTTDRSAIEMNTALASLSMMTRTTPRAICRVALLWISGVYNSAEINYHEAVWGNTLSVKPSITKDGYGEFTVTYPTTVVDALGATQSLSFNAVVSSYDYSGSDNFTFVINATPVVNEIQFKLRSTSTMALGEPLGAASDTLLVTFLIF